jgi:hypothetical protein
MNGGARPIKGLKQVTPGLSLKGHGRVTTPDGADDYISDRRARPILRDWYQDIKALCFDA